MTPRCYIALERLTNIVNPVHSWPNRASYEMRLAKYATRSFDVAVPGLDWSQVDVPRLLSSTTKQLKGLGRLLKIGMEMKRIPLDCDPHRIESLKSDTRECLDPAEALLSGVNGFYDESPESVFVPSAYCDGDPTAMCWYDFIGGASSDFPLCSVSRDPAWIEIEFGPEDSDEVVTGVPLRLMDSWGDSLSSREFLNSCMEKEDLDSIYYSGAFKPEEKSD